MYWQSYQYRLHRHLDLRAVRVRFRLPRVQGRGHAGGALPFATFAIAAAAAFAIAADDRDKLTAANAAPARDLLRALSRNCDIKLLVFKLHLQWRYDGDVLASRVQVRVPRVRGCRDQAGGALPCTRSPPAAPDHRHKIDRPHKSRARCWPVQR